jgi:dihydroneopterin aldolase
VKIDVEDLKFQCIIGILDFERVKPQDVIVNISIEYEYQKEFLNYVKIVEIIKEMMIEINLKLIKEFKGIKSIDLKITKPSILPDCKVSVSYYYKSQS